MTQRRRARQTHPKPTLRTGSSQELPKVEILRAIYQKRNKFTRGGTNRCNLLAFQKELLAGPSATRVWKSDEASFLKNASRKLRYASPEMIPCNPDPHTSWSLHLLNSGGISKRRPGFTRMATSSSRDSAQKPSQAKKAHYVLPCSVPSGN